MPHLLFLRIPSSEKTCVHVRGEQFHLYVLNCLLHSVNAFLTPFWIISMSCGCLPHICRCLLSNHAIARQYFLTSIDDLVWTLRFLFILLPLLTYNALKYNKTRYQINYFRKYYTIQVVRTVERLFLCSYHKPLIRKNTKQILLQT